MKVLLLLAVLAGCAFFAWKEWAVVPEAPTPTPTPEVRLAPKGVFYVVKSFSVQHDSGIHGFPMLKQVSLIREEGDELIVTDGQIEARAPKTSFSNDLSVVDRLRQALPPATPIPNAEDSLVSREISKISRDVTSAELELERLQGIARRTNSRLTKVRERVSRGEIYDSLTDLRQVAKELEDDLSKLDANKEYWSEMVRKLQAYKDALVESERLAASVRDGAQDIERAKQAVADADAKARASAAALNAHRASQLR